MSRTVSREVARIGFLGLAATMTLALPTAAQSPGESPGNASVHESWDVKEVHGLGHGHVTWTAPERVVESTPAAPGDPGFGVSRQAVMERADPNKAYFIDILFFYTDGFADDFVRLGRSMSDEIWQSVSLLNAALANSRVKTTFRIVGVEQLPGMPDDQDVAIRMIVEDDHAIRRRNALGADLVYALVDDRAGFLGQACEPHSEAGFSAESCFWGSVNNFCGGGGLGCDDVWRTVLRHEVGHSSQSGLLYFFERNNVEVLIKVLDGCGVNGHRWVFVAPVTDLAFNLHVESPTGERWTHRNRLGRTADTAADTSAFPCASSV